LATPFPHASQRRDPQRVLIALVVFLLFQHTRIRALQPGNLAAGDLIFKHVK
jgi:hypothetical protein